MNILFFARLYYPHIGGVERHVSEICKILIAKGHTITLVTEHVSDLNAKDTEVLDGVTIYRMPVGNNEWLKKFRIWSFLFKHRELLQQADIIHCHDVFYWYFPFKFFYRKKAYVTYHGYESYPVRKKAIVIRRISEVLSDGNICVGDFIKRWYHTKPTFVIYGATEIPKENVKYKDPYSAVFIGRLDEQTGVIMYKNAYRKVKRQYPKFHLTVVGDGKFREELTRESDIKVLGFIHNVFPYLEQNRFAFVSRYLALLEAMAYKRLAFAVFNNPLQEDYLKMAPFAKFIVIAPEQDIAEKMLYYLKHPEEEKKAVDSAYAWVKNQTWEKVVDTYLTLWGQS